MARWHPNSCKVCERDVSETGHISATGLCPKCSLEREVANFTAMKSKSGHFYDHWARRSFMAARRALVASEQSEA